MRVHDPPRSLSIDQNSKILKMGQKGGETQWPDSGGKILCAYGMQCSSVRCKSNHQAVTTKKWGRKTKTSKEARKRIKVTLDQILCQKSEEKMYRTNFFLSKSHRFFLIFSARGVERGTYCASNLVQLNCHR